MSKASVYYAVTNVNGKHDVRKLKRELDTLQVVSSVSVNDKTEEIAVDFDTTGASNQKIKSKIEDLGFEVTQTKFENHIM